MTRCIYCLTATPGSKAHVVPEALGGSLTFLDVCASCNSQQGDSFEGRTINSILFALARYVLGIKGKSRKNANPLALTYTATPELKVRLNDDLKPYVIPSLNFGEVAEGSVRISATYDAADRDRLASDIAKGLVRRGLADNLAIATQKVREVVEADARAGSAKLSELRCSFSVDLADLRLLYLKIAYEVAYLHHGADYLEDRVATLLRDAVNHRAGSPAIRGQIPADSGLFSLILGDSEHHYVMLLGNMAVVTLFGLVGSFECSSTRTFCLSEQDAVVYDFDAVGGSYHKSSLLELLSSLLSDENEA